MRLFLPHEALRETVAAAPSVPCRPGSRAEDAVWVCSKPRPEESPARSVGAQGRRPARVCDGRLRPGLHGCDFIRSHRVWLEIKLKSPFKPNRKACCDAGEKQKQRTDSLRKPSLPGGPVPRGLSCPGTWAAKLGSFSFLSCCHECRSCGPSAHCERRASRQLPGDPAGDADMSHDRLRTALR